MKIPTVIFALSQSEAISAIDYKKKHPNENVIILSPDLSVQIILRSANLKPLEYFNNSYYKNRHYYTDYYWKVEKEAVRLTQLVLSLLCRFNTKSKDYLMPFQNRLEMAYFEILQTYTFYQSLEKKWHPKNYIISDIYKNQNTNLYTPFASLWELLRTFFIPVKKLKYLRSFPQPKIRVRLKSLLSNIYSTNLSITLFLVLIDRVKNYFIKYKFKEGNNSDVLIFSGGRNLYIYQELLSLLFNNKHIKFTIITSPLTLNDEINFRQKKIPFIPLAHYFTSELNILQNKIAEKLIPQMLSNLLKSRYKNIFSSYPISMQSAFRKKTEQIIGENMHKNIKQTLLARKLMTIFSPHLVITTHDPGPTAMPFALAAKRRGLSSLVLMHGWQDTILGVNHESENIAVWGEYVAKWYRRKLHNKNTRVFSLGYPVFDVFFKEQRLKVKNDTKFQKINPKLKIAVLVTMYLPSTAQISKFLFELFSEFSEEKDNYEISLRTHPSQPTKGILELAESLEIAVILNPPVSLEQYILNSDVILTWDTTAMFWAMVYGKPLFYCTPNWSEGITPIRKLGGAWMVKSSKDFFTQLKRLKMSTLLLKQLRKEQKNFLKEIIGVTDGSSSQKHYELIMRLLKESTGVN